MATDNTIVSYFTNAGQALATEVQAGTTKLTFTKAEASNTNHSSDSTDTLAQITALDSVKQTAEIGAVLILNKNTVQVSIDFNQNEITDDYDLWTIGLFAKSDTGDEILYSVTPLEHSQYMYSDTSGSTLTINLNTAVEQAASVNLVVSPADSVTSAQLTATLQSYDTSAQVNDKIAAIPKPDLSNYTTVTDLNNGLSAKVNTTDMRKPAKDVLGLDEIQSSILPNGTDLYTLINTSGQPLSYHASTYASAQTMVNKPTTKLNAFKLNTASIGDKTSSNFNYTCLTLNDYSDGSTYEAFINTDGSGAITVATPWYKVADDSKVAHLSGANNFDTVPTVNNNPLLLASSLPSDLARTGQDTNFTGKLQKSGIDVATKSDVTNAVNTATANMANYNMPTNFTAGLQSGGVDVATAADLKSVEDSAWYQLDNKYIIPASGYTLAPYTTILYKIDDSFHTLYLSGSIVLTDFQAYNVLVTVQLGSIVKSILTSGVAYLGYGKNLGNSGWTASLINNRSTNLTFATVAGVACMSATTTDISYVTYDELV